MTEEAQISDPPRRRTAFLLNLFFPPAGYVYAGMPWVAVVCTVALVVCAFWGMAVSLSPDSKLPPTSGLMAVLYAISTLIGAGLFTGAHAALRLRKQRARGSKLWLLAGALYGIALAAWIAAQWIGRAG